MRCDKCRNEAVFFQPTSGRHMCGRHLAADTEVRAKRSVRMHHWMETGDHIAVVLFGDKKGAALALFLQKLVAGRRDIRLSALPVGDRGAGAGSFAAAMRIAELLRIPCIEMSLPGSTVSPESERVTKLALAFTLDDIAREVLVQFLSGDAEQLVHPHSSGSSMVPVICPFIAVPLDEVESYWDHEGEQIDLLPPLPASDAFSRDAGAMFRDFHRRHPATGHALLHLAEELSSCRAADIAAATIGRDGSFSRGTLTEVTGNGT